MALRTQRMTWTWLAVTACLAGAFIGGLVYHADAAPKPGMVKAKGGFVFQGQVDEESMPGKVIVTQANGQKVELFKQAVESIIYFNTPKEEFDARLGALGRADVAGRVALARWALSKNEPALAAEAVRAAKAIDPNNVEVNALEKQVASLMPKPVTPEVGPASKPATKPTEKVAGPAIRTATPEEIQIVRIKEMKPGEKLRVAPIPPAVRKQLLDAGIVTPAEIGKMQPPDLAAVILERGTDAMKAEVKFLSDPVAMADYKLKVNKIVISGCAASNCHGAADSKTLRLFNGTDEASVYSNFIILQRTEKTIDGVQRLMIDRANPNNSLLLSFMLPTNLTRVPHPETQGFKPPAKSVNDPGFIAATEWVTRTLNITPPDYSGIDLSQPPPEKPAPGK